MTIYSFPPFILPSHQNPPKTTTGITIHYSDGTSQYIHVPMVTANPINPDWLKGAVAYSQDDPNA